MTSRRNFLKKSAALGLTSSIVGSAFANEVAAVNHSSFPDVCNQESGLKIKSIETFSGRHQTFVRVIADDGSEGFGQVANYNNNITAQVLHEMVAPHVLGKDPYMIGKTIEDSIEVNYKFPWSFICRAASGIETALWDLRGKREGKPVVELLGGKTDPVSAYASSMSRDIKPADEANRMKKLYDDFGFKACKIRVGKVNGHDEDQWEGRTEAILPAVSKVVGGDMAIFADGNSCYTPKKAIEIGKLIEDNGGSMFEEPCPFWELEWTAEVTKALNIQVSGGEQDNDMTQWRRMINMDAVDVVQPDVCYIGGVSRTLQVAEWAASVGKTCVPHSANLSFITLFALHLMGAIKNAAPFLEFSIEEVDWVKNLYKPQLKIEDGKVLFPDGPGWGVSINKEWLSNAEYKKSG